MPTLLAALERYARSSEPTPESVLRQLVEHAGWFVPVGFAPTVLQGPTLEHVCQWGDGDNLRDHRLRLYTSAEAGAAALAAGVSMGAYGGPLRGDLVFANLRDEVELDINLPIASHVYIRSVLVDSIRRLARGITLEHAFVGNRGNLIELLQTAEAFDVLVHPEHGIATANGAGGLTNPVMAFTARDCLMMLVKSMDTHASELHTGSAPVLTLLENLEKGECDGLLLNPLGPGPTTLLDRDAALALLADLRKANREACHPTDS
ncbi:MAG: hypothetical protein H0T79_04390 [Deltaproteobacteria bacterium]|nr:hypothetical protein [Deltaproteobacteria bacterium]